MLPLTKEELKFHEDETNCYICGKRMLKKLAKSKIIGKLEIIAIIQANIKVQHLVFAT